MRWLVDECVAPELVANLRAQGHDVVFALESYRAKSDAFLFQVAAREQRILLTDDTDFGELTFRRTIQPRPAAVILMRISSERPLEKWARLFDAISQYGDSLLGNYIVIGEKRSRLRPLPTP